MKDCHVNEYTKEYKQSKGEKSTPRKESSRRLKEELKEERTEKRKSKEVEKKRWKEEERKAKEVEPPKAEKKAKEKSMEGRKVEILLKERKGGKGSRLFHRHGPDPQLPPASKKHVMWHNRSPRCLLKCYDSQAFEQWMINFQAATKYSSKTRKPKKEKKETKETLAEGEQFSSDLETCSAISFDSDDEEMYIDGGLNVGDVETEQLDHVQLMKRLELVSSSDSNEQSIIVLDPRKGKPVIRKVKRRKSRETENSSSPDSQNSLESSAVAEAENVEDEEAKEEVKSENATKDPENREGLLKLITRAVGLDITTIALPVTLNEPCSFVQRMCEAVVYHDLLRMVCQLLSKLTCRPASAKIQLID